MLHNLHQSDYRQNVLFCLFLHIEVIQLDNLLMEWKEKHEDLFQLELSDYSFVFRVLNRQEYQEMAYVAADECELQEMICEVAVLYPPYDFRNGLGGIASALSTHIMDQSFLREGQAKDLLSYFRAEMTQFDAQCDCLIHEAFPNFTLEEISTWTVKKTLYYLSRAEFIVRNLRGIPIQMIEEEPEPAPQPAPMPTKQQKMAQEQDQFASSEQEYPELKWFSHMDHVTGDY